MTAVTLDSRVVQSSQQVAADLGDELVILGFDEGAYFGVRGVGISIWTALREPTRLGDLVATLLTEFDVDRERCERDLLAFVEALRSRRLVDVLPPS